MPAESDLAMGLVNVVAETTVVAMPAEFAAMAAFSAVSMVGTVGCVEVAPVHAGFSMPSRAAASSNPYCVGVKNVLSVTWFTNVNFHFGVVGKFPATSFAPALAVLDDELHVASRAEVAAVALTRSVP